MDAIIERALAEVAACTDDEQRNRLMRESNPALGNYFRRNRPATYRPDALPDHVLPTAKSK